MANFERLKADLHNDNNVAVAQFKTDFAIPSQFSYNLYSIAL